MTGMTMAVRCANTEPKTELPGGRIGGRSDGWCIASADHLAQALAGRRLYHWYNGGTTSCPVRLSDLRYRLPVPVWG